MKQTGASCLRCGICCDLFGHTISATGRDLQRWRAAGREDLIAMAGEDGTLWIGPATGERLDHCPWVRRGEDLCAVCSIHELKPEICRGYPTELHKRRCVRGVEF